MTCTRKTPALPGLLLAAGLSRRMGDINKLLLPVDGTAMVRRTADTLLSAGVSPLIAVTGPGAGDIRAALSGLAVIFAVNADPKNGMAGSIRAGLRQLASATGTNDATHVLIALADMPYVRAATIGTLIAAAYRHTDQGIIVPSYGNRRGNPVLWHRRYFSKLAALEGDKGGRSLMTAHADEVLMKDCDDPGIHMDVDTAADATRLGLIRT